MKVLIPISALLFLCAITSCKKNNDEPGSNLSQFNITFFDSLSYQINYERDGNNRVTAVYDRIKGKILAVTRVQYNTDGTLNKVSTHELDSAAARDYLQFEYNASGKISKRTQHGGTMAIIEDYNTYSYDAQGHLVTDSQFSKVNNTYQLKYYTNFHYTGNNITEADWYEIKNGTPELSRRVKYEYGTGLNPFRSTPEEYYFFERSSAPYDISILSENVLYKQYDAKGNNPYALLQTSVYEYNSNNYPSKLNSTSPTNSKKNFSVQYQFQ